jgi:hypothetical protein
MKNVEAAGILMLQECPNEKCSVAPWDVPINCLKATCEVDKGGCGEIFCFLCTALYRPYILHGNYYHRPQCTFYEPICCDQNQCIKNGKENCVLMKYLPGPCEACVAANDANACSHSDWTCCSECKKTNKVCVHHCSECKKLGKKCAPPGNPRDENGHDGLKYKIIPHEILKIEEEKLKKK